MAAVNGLPPDFGDPLANLHEFARVDPSSEPSRQAHAKILAGKTTNELIWWSKDTVAVVTGSNKGVGLEIVRQLSKKGITTVLTSRDEGKGVAALDQLESEGLENVLFHPLDVTSPDSAAKFANWIKETTGGIDLLVCNAGIGALEVNYEVAKQIVGTNYFGQKIPVKAFLPLLRPSPAGARILFVGSEMGQLRIQKNQKVKQRVTDIEHLTEEDVDELAYSYLEDVKAGRQAEWSDDYYPAYNESKMLLNAYTRVLAKSLSNRPDGSKIYVNVCTPGFTATDMVGNHPFGRTMEDGADTPVWILLYPSGGPTGGFFRDRADFDF